MSENHYFKPYYLHGIADWRDFKSTNLLYTYRTNKVDQQPKKQVIHHLLQERRDPSRREEELRTQLLARRWE